MGGQKDRLTDAASCLSSSSELLAYKVWISCSAAETAASAAATRVLSKHNSSACMASKDLASLRAPS
eukprot:scaffold645747_cov29-Prasinocladus_malaysianus.AAC.1